MSHQADQDVWQRERADVGLRYGSAQEAASAYVRLLCCVPGSVSAQDPERIQLGVQPGYRPRDEPFDALDDLHDLHVVFAAALVHIVERYGESKGGKMWRIWWFNRVDDLAMTRTSKGKTSLNPAFELDSWSHSRGFDARARVDRAVCEAMVNRREAREAEVAGEKLMEEPWESFPREIIIRLWEGPVGPLHHSLDGGLFADS